MSILRRFIRKILKEEFVEKEFDLFRAEIEQIIQDEQELDKTSRKYVKDRPKPIELELPEYEDTSIRNLSKKILLEGKTLKLSFLYEIAEVLKKQIRDMAIYYQARWGIDPFERLAYLKMGNVPIEEKIEQFRQLRERIQTHEDLVNQIKGSPNHGFTLLADHKQLLTEIRAKLIEGDFESVFDIIPSEWQEHHPKLLSVKNRLIFLERKSRLGTISESDYRQNKLEWGLFLYDSIEELFESRA